MGDRIIFTVKSKGATLAYIYQNWGAGDSYWTEWDGEGGTVNSDTFEPHREPGNQA